MVQYEAAMPATFVQLSNATAHERALCTVTCLTFVNPLRRDPLGDYEILDQAPNSSMNPSYLIAAGWLARKKNLPSHTVACHLTSIEKLAAIFIANWSKVWPAYDSTSPHMLAKSIAWRLCQRRNDGAWL